MTLEKGLEALRAAVPTGKAVVWIVATMVTSFLAGIGFVTSTGEAKRSLSLVPELSATQLDHAMRLRTVEARLDEAERRDQQILCLVRLSVTAEVLSPLEVNDRCGN